VFSHISISRQGFDLGALRSTQKEGGQMKDLLAIAVFTMLALLVLSMARPRADHCKSVTTDEHAEAMCNFAMSGAGW